jgi:phospholipid-translocating ATPase
LDGFALQKCLDHFLNLFLDLASSAKAVLCCRCSPQQKAQIVTLIKNYDNPSNRRRALAIGDGGNDVAMILKADIGIGLLGKEGRQAALAADVSLTKFRLLVPLLLYYGRLSYERNARLSQLVLHRGLVLSLVQLLFSIVWASSAVPLHSGWLLVGYTSVFTMLPLLSIVLDRDVSLKETFLYPELYAEMQFAKFKAKSRLTLHSLEGEYNSNGLDAFPGARDQAASIAQSGGSPPLSNETLLSWLILSVYQAAVIFLLSVLLLESPQQNNLQSLYLFSDTGASGNAQSDFGSLVNVYLPNIHTTNSISFQRLISLSFTCLVACEWINVALLVRRWHWLMISAQVLSLFFFCLAVVSLDSYFEQSFVFSFEFLWKVTVITAVSVLPPLAVQFLYNKYNPSQHSKVN